MGNLVQWSLKTHPWPTWFILIHEPITLCEREKSAFAHYIYIYIYKLTYSWAIWFSDHWRHIHGQRGSSWSTNQSRHVMLTDKVVYLVMIREISDDIFTDSSMYGCLFSSVTNYWLVQPQRCLNLFWTRKYATACTHRCQLYVVYCTPSWLRK